MRYWELGNEPYVMEAKRPDGSPNPLMLRPEAYARRINAVMAAMRAVDPTLHLGLPFALDTLSGQPWRPGGEPASVVGPQLGYADRLLAGLAQPQQVGWLALHHYMPLVDNPLDAQGRPLPLPDAQRMYWGAVAGSEPVRHHLDHVTRFWREHPAHRARAHARAGGDRITTRFSATAAVQGKEVPENAWVATLAGAMFAADVLRVYAESPQVEAALQWSLTNNWVFGAVLAGHADHDARLRPIGEVMRWGQALFRSGQVVASRVDGGHDRCRQPARGLCRSLAGHAPGQCHRHPRRPYLARAGDPQRPAEPGRGEAEPARPESASGECAKACTPSACSTVPTVPTPALRGSARAAVHTPAAPRCAGRCRRPAWRWRRCGWTDAVGQWPAEIFSPAFRRYTVPQ